jgi:hypothetical protein
LAARLGITTLPLDELVKIVPPRIFGYKFLLLFAGQSKRSTGDIWRILEERQKSPVAFCENELQNAKNRPAFSSKTE